MLYGQVDERIKFIISMGKEINLLKNYPRTKRNIFDREKQKSEEDRRVARTFQKDFFDGDRRHGYGGFFYNSKFWQPVIPDLREYWNLSSDSSILDVGCAKGFMLYDFSKLIPGIHLKGIDISEYAIDNSISETKSCLFALNQALRAKNAKSGMNNAGPQAGNCKPNNLEVNNGLSTKPASCIAV